MPVSDEDRRRFEAQARSLREIETDEELSPDQAALVIAAANEDRARAGRPSLRVDRDAELPEEGFYRRARALGFMRNSRSSS